MQKEVYFSRRNLPHIYIPNSTYFITFRLKGSIPQTQLKKLIAWKKSLKQANSNAEKYKQDLILFGKYDKLLHNNRKNNYLINPIIAKIVASQMHKYDNKEYTLICYSIMPNHVHVVFSLLENSKTIDKIMQTIKRVSAYQANKILGKGGSFWQSESYDHIVRDDNELQRIVNYTLYNPVKAKLADDWKEWKFNYLKYEK